MQPKKWALIIALTLMVIKSIHAMELINNELELERSGIVHPKQNLTPHEGDIWMGIGVSTHKDDEQITSELLPIDVTNMLYTAKSLLKYPEKNLVHILIANSLAKDNSANEKAVDSITKIYCEQLQHLLKYLGMAKYSKITLSSDLNSNKDYLNILDDTKTSKEMEVAAKLYPESVRYIVSQTAIARYYTTIGATCKIGWCKNPDSYSKERLLGVMKGIDNCRDEPWFDNLAGDLLKEMRTVYTVARIDKRGLPRPPYTSYSKEECLVGVNYWDGLVTPVLVKRWIGLANSIIRENMPQKPKVSRLLEGLTRIKSKYQPEN